MDAISVINVTIYDLLLNCYMTVTTAIGSSGRLYLGLFESRGPAGAARPINYPSLHCHDPKVSISDNREPALSTMRG
jgi:hypothetical protein